MNRTARARLNRYFYGDDAESVEAIVGLIDAADM